MTILLFLLIIILSISTGFLAKELLRKFKFWKKFQIKYKHQFCWTYSGDKKPGMYTLQLTSNRNFHGLIGFDFSIGPLQNTGYDVSGHIDSEKDNKCTISLYLGSGPCNFIFLFDQETSISIDIIAYTVKPNYIFLPHWWQRLY